MKYKAELRAYTADTAYVSVSRDGIPLREYIGSSKEYAIQAALVSQQTSLNRVEKALLSAQKNYDVQLALLRAIEELRDE